MQSTRDGVVGDLDQNDIFKKSRIQLKLMIFANLNP